MCLWLGSARYPSVLERKPWPMSVECESKCAPGQKLPPESLVHAWPRVRLRERAGQLEAGGEPG